MGRYVNPGTETFATIRRSDYVDKTGLIAQFNATLNSTGRLVLVSRPRRFGKTFAAAALAAYYSCGADSRTLFDGLAISHDPSYEEHLNAYNVIRLDITTLYQAVGANVVPEVTRVLVPELRALVPDAGTGSAGTGGELAATMYDVVQATGRKFVVIIDEWDAVYRLSDDVAAQDSYANWLRALFKGGDFTGDVIAGAYLTGILPIRKYNYQSAVSDFREYTMVSPGAYAPYVGFTEAEVEGLCDKYDMSIADMRCSYDGYDLPRVGHVYAPYSVMQACERGIVGAYWVTTEAYEGLRLYIDMDFDGLRATIIRLLGGDVARVDTLSFNNLMGEVRSADDVLTLLVHLGYLAYDVANKTVRIPNEEIRDEFRRALKGSHHSEIARIVRESDDLLRLTWALDGDAVASAIQRVHRTSAPSWFYNDEQALRAVVKAAYIAAVDHYVTIEELESGRGRADIVFVPRRGTACPAMVVELKWNRDAETALAQIRERHYPDVLADWDGEVLLVGITYDPSGDAHACAIERLAPTPDGVL